MEDLDHMHRRYEKDELTCERCKKSQFCGFRRIKGAVIALCLNCINEFVKRTGSTDPDWRMEEAFDLTT